MAAHRYWRVIVTAVTSPGTQSYYGFYPACVIGNIELRLAAGGANQAGGGVYSASSDENGNNGSDAFDGSPSNVWFAADGSALPQWVACDLGAGNEADIKALTMQMDDYDEPLLPKDFKLQHSDDNTNWTDYIVVTGQAMSAYQLYEFVSTANSAPVITSGDTFSVNEGDTAVTTVTATDADGDTPVFSIAGGDDAAVFTIDANSGVLSFVNAPDYSAPADLNADNIYLVTVQASDGTDAVQQPITVTVLEVIIPVYWRPSVIVGAVDMSARIFGDVDVDETEDGARVASFSLMPFSGAILPYDFIGQSVTIDFNTYGAAGQLAESDRLFTGIVEEPIYNPDDGSISLSCTDGLQEFIEQSDKATIDTLIGGYYSADVFNETDDLWQYSQDRLSTQPCNLNLDEAGAARKIDWAPKGIEDAAFNVADIIHDSISLSLIKRRDVLNTVNIELSYRYGRKWQRELAAAWSYPRTFYEYLSESTSLPTRSMVLSALNSGWGIKNVSWNKLPVSGEYTNSEGDLTTWGISDELRDSLVFGVSSNIYKRWLQDVTEVYTVTVEAAASVTVHGVLKQDVKGYVDVPVADNYEQAPEQGVAITTIGADSETGDGYDYEPPETGNVQINSSDYIVDPVSRTPFDDAANTQIGIARTSILQSHRSNTLTIDALINPAISTAKTILVNSAKITGNGKVRRVRHKLSTGTGRAVTTIDVSIYQPKQAGQSDDAIAPPATLDSSPAAIPGAISLSSYFGGKAAAPVYDPNWLGYIGNWATREASSEWYPSEFRVDIPAIEDTVRDTAQFAAQSTHAVAIPENDLTITA